MKRAAIDSWSGCVATIAIVGVVHMLVRRVAGRGSMYAIVAIVLTMTHPRRPGNLEGQYGEQEQYYEMFHGGGV